MGRKSDKRDREKEDEKEDKRKGRSGRSGDEHGGGASIFDILTSWAGKDVWG